MKIQLLGNNMINKIAAGEVVESPVSVVKELLENSIDAGAMQITTEIKDGGISYVRISDNGCGIAKDELRTAFLRHATSKIRNFDDLTNVMTLGFRGEALSSISSVSQMEMVTKTADAVSAAKIEIHGGQIISLTDIGAVTGTTVIMRNLFYNTPARRKFLKKASSEAGLIHELIQRLALAHPEISFKFINNNQNVLATNGNGDLTTAVFYVYGKDVKEKLIEIPYTQTGDIGLSGFICAPQTARGNRAFGNFFINGRYVKSRAVQSAVEDAFKNRLMSGKFPIYILNMNIPPNHVDVNVHPSKLEVRFEDDDKVYESVFSSVKAALENEGTGLIADAAWDTPKRERKTYFVSEAVETDIGIYSKEDKKPYITPEINKDIPYEDCPPASSQYMDARRASAPMADKIPENDAPEQTFGHIAYPPKQETPVSGSSASKTHEETELFSDYKIIGQIFSTYWIIEQNEKMYLIDQHAAHERVLYEEYLEKHKTGDIASQLLLEGLTVRLTPIESETVLENMELFSSFGFELEEFGENIYMLRALPYIFREPAGADFFADIVDALCGFDKNKPNPHEVRLETIARISCKAAVKANNILSKAECTELINKLKKSENPFNCPHGRPTIISMSKYEIEKKFGRK